MSTNTNTNTNTNTDTSAPGRRSPHEIISIATAFWTSKALLSAVEMGVFAELVKGPISAGELCARLGLKGRGASDFLDVLVSIGLLERSDDGVYRNTELADAYLDPGKPAQDISGYLEYLNSAFPAWSQMSAVLRSGDRLDFSEALRAAADGGASTASGAVLTDADAEADTFGEAFASPEQVTGFVRSMTGFSLGAHQALTSAFDWSEVREVIDVGCSEGAFLGHVMAAHPHLTGTGFDLPQVADRFRVYLESVGIADRVRFAPGDFFTDPLPSGDVLVMGHVLHDWNLDIKQMLIRKAYEALRPGGSLLVYEMLVDDERRCNTTGMLTSLNVSLVSAGGLGYTGAECRAWLTEAGFREVSVTHLDGPEYMVVGTK
ncbi:methyltransferase [Streptomyces caeruleatus]|uniref:Methyltransferase n=1 Tax=Streptomyces caeruleatus TaxID=661399 RepID=A0A101TFK2_9ACTN|nr:methyltransferase [Streptomyces caeruleatus]KUN91384.1 methyltransferase [Streptomyces caeruleatus]